MAPVLRLALPLLAATVVFAQTKVAPDLKDRFSGTQLRAPQQMVDVIIQFPKGRDGDVLRLIGGGRLKRQFTRIPAIHTQIPLFLLKALESSPLIKYITPDRQMKGALDYATQTTYAPYSWTSGWDGTGIGVAVIDSGISPDSDLLNGSQNTRVVYNESFLDDPSTADKYGHGTHVAGIIASAGRDSTGSGFFRTFKGIAPNVNLINLRVLDQNGSGQESDVIAAIQRAIELKNTYNIRVINLSLGRPIFESYTLDPLCQAV
jgi:serine protease AprX